MSGIENVDSQTFPLLSTVLQEVVKNGENSHLCVVQQWIKRHITDLMGQGFFEEEEVLAITSEMLDDAKRVLLIEPASVSQLREAYQKIEGREDEYLKFALTQQREKYRKLLAGFSESNLEKKLKNVLRNLEKKARNIQEMEEEVISIQNGEYLGKYVVDLARSAEQILQKKSSRKSSKGLEQIIEELRMMREELETRDTSTILDVFGNDAKIEWKVKIEKATQEVKILRELQSWLERRIQDKKTIHNILAQTRTRLEELGITQTPQPITPLPPPKPITQTPSGKKKKHRRGNGEKNPYTNGKKDPLGEKGEKEKTKKEKLDISISQLKKAINCARETNNQIRLLSSSQNGANHLETWKKIFKILGFTESIKTTTYQNLGNTPDTTTAVVVPLGMSTHTNIGKWRVKQKNSFIMLAHDRHILARLESAVNFSVDV